MSVDPQELDALLRAANERVDSGARAVSVNGREPQFGLFAATGWVTELGGPHLRKVPVGYDWTVELDGVVGMRGVEVDVRMGKTSDDMPVTGRARVAEISAHHGSPVRTTLAGLGPLSVNGREIR